MIAGYFYSCYFDNPTKIMRLIFL